MCVIISTCVMVLAGTISTPEVRQQKRFMSVVYFQIFKNRLTEICQVPTFFSSCRLLRLVVRQEIRASGEGIYFFKHQIHVTADISTSSTDSLTLLNLPSRGLEDKSCLRSPQLMPGFFSSHCRVNQVGGMTRQMIVPKMLISKSSSVQPRRSP